MARPVVLSGGAEFAPESNPLDRALLRLSGQRSPHVVIVPVAAVNNPRRAVRSGVRYFDALGARAEYVMVVDADTADLGGHAADLEHAHIIYLTDGSPLDTVTGLQGTETLSILRRAWESGMVLAACGAGAMALCEFYWDSGIWEPGLGLLTGFVVLPHHEIVSARFTPERLRKDLPKHLLILGLDDATGVLLNDLSHAADAHSTQARVVGPGSVTVYRADIQTEYTDGQTFLLDIAEQT